MRCASGKVGAPAADETETLKQSFAEWKKFRPVLEFPSSEELGASLWKVLRGEGRRGWRYCTHRTRRRTNVHHYQFELAEGLLSNLLVVHCTSSNPAEGLLTFPSFISCLPNDLGAAQCAHTSLISPSLCQDWAGL